MNCINQQLNGLMKIIKKNRFKKVNTEYINV